MITGEDYQKLSGLLTELRDAPIRDTVLNIQRGLLLLYSTYGNGSDINQLESETYDYSLIIQILLLLDDVKKKHGKLSLPEQMDLTQEEIRMIESRRAMSKAIDLVGGKEGIIQHRENLKKVFGEIEDQDLLNTFRMVDAQLEASMLFEEEIQAMD